MRRYKIVTCILLLLSVFSFVLAAPVPVQEVCEACVDTVDDRDNVVIGSWKRANEEGPLSAHAQQEPSSSSSSPSSGECNHRCCPHLAGLNSWNPEGEAKSIQPGTLTETQPALSSNAKSLESALNGVKIPPGLVIGELLPGGTWTGIQPQSSSKAKSVAWSPLKEVHLKSGLIYSEMLPPKIPEVKPPSGMIYSEMPPPEKPQPKSIFGFWPKVPRV